MSDERRPRPPDWARLGELGAHFAAEWPRYAAQLALWLAAFAVSLRVMGIALREFVPAFVFVYVAAVAIACVGAWEYASRYNLEAPLVALAAGLVLSNLKGHYICGPSD